VQGKYKYFVEALQQNPEEQNINIRLMMFGNRYFFLKVIIAVLCF